MRIEKPSAGSTWTLALTICLLTFPQGATRSGVDAHQGAGEIVEGARPVAKAMALLSREFGWKITYEDPAYVNGDDLLDITKTPINGKRLIIPRGGRVWLPDNLVAAAYEDPVALIETVIGTEEMSRGRVKRFKVLRSESMFHVVPDRVLDAAGQWQSADPILDTTITISHGAVSLGEFLEILCANLSAVGPTKVITGSMPITARIPRGSAALIMVPRQKRTAPVRTLLVEALSKTQVPLKWMLMYDPSSATFYLNIGPLGAGPM